MLQTLRLRLSGRLGGVTETTLEAEHPSASFHSHPFERSAPPAGDQTHKGHMRTQLAQGELCAQNTSMLYLFLDIVSELLYYS